MVELLRKAEKELHSADGNNVYRAQGKTAILNVILDIERDIRQYERDLLDGKVKRIEETSDALVGQQKGS